MWTHILSVLPDHNLFCDKSLCSHYIAIDHIPGSEETRVRKPWHALTYEEQMLYSRGFQRLHREGTLILFFESHDDASTNYGIHQTTQNFFWHSYWLWEMENSFRDLGEEYECFTLPYWDVTHDAEYWYSTDSPQIDDLPIYNSNLGGNGNIDNDYCVEDYPWSLEEYNTEYLCADDETSPHCCLKRYHEDTHTSKLSTRKQMSNAIFVNKTYNDYETFFKFVCLSVLSVWECVCGYTMSLNHFWSDKMVRYWHGAMACKSLISL